MKRREREQSQKEEVFRIKIGKKYKTKEICNDCKKTATPSLKDISVELIRNTQGKLKIMKKYFEKMFRD